MKHKYSIHVLLAMAILFVMALVSNMDYDDAVAEHEYHCEMVGEGHWPNYKELECEK